MAANRRARGGGGGARLPHHHHHHHHNHAVPRGALGGGGGAHPRALAPLHAHTTPPARCGGKGPGRRHLAGRRVNGARGEEGGARPRGLAWGVFLGRGVWPNGGPTKKRSTRHTICPCTWLTGWRLRCTTAVGGWGGGEGGVARAADPAWPPQSETRRPLPQIHMLTGLVGSSAGGRYPRAARWSLAGVEALPSPPLSL